MKATIAEEIVEWISESRLGCVCDVWCGWVSRGRRARACRRNTRVFIGRSKSPAQPQIR